MSYRQRVAELWPATGVGQRTIIAVSTALLLGNGVLMGTAMAVIVGRRGSPFAVSMVMAAYFFGKMVFAPVWGTVADLTGRRRLVLFVSSGLGTVAIIPLAFVEGAWTAIGFRTLYAVFVAAFTPVMLTIVSTRGGAESRGQSVGFFTSSGAVGRTISQVAAGVLLGLLVPTDLFLVLAGIALVTTGLLALVVDPTPTPDEQLSIRVLVASARRRLFPPKHERGHLSDHGLRWLYVAIALRNMTVLGVMSLMPVFLTETVALSEFVMGSILAVNAGGQAISMYLFGRAADRFGRKPLITGGMAGTGLFALVGSAAVVPDATMLRIGTATGGFVVLAGTYSALRTGSIAFVGDVASAERESELMGLLSTAKGSGGVAGPPLFGIAATFTSYQFSFAVGSLLAFAAAVIVSLAVSESNPALDRT